MLESHGCCKQESADVTFSTWVVTPDGRQRFKLKRTFHNPQPVLVPRTDVDIMDATPFELAYSLRDRGW
eukprot:8947614-Lingulodinium_polyedra.AAC.1